MVDLVALKAEIAKPAYAGLTDAQIAVAVMAAEIVADRTVAGLEIGQLWARRGVLGAAHERSQRGNLQASQRALAYTAIEMIDRDGFSGLDPTKPAQRTALVNFFDSLVADTIMSEADKTATLALINQPRLGREVFGNIDASDIANARAA